MKRLTILTVIAVVTFATSSGCRTCGSLFNFYRGDSCSTSGFGSYDSYGSGTPYDSNVVYDGGTLLPAPTTVLPGPVTATP